MAEPETPRDPTEPDATQPQPPDPLAIEPSGPWQPPRGPRTRLIAWLILAVIGLGLVAMLIVALGG